MNENQSRMPLISYVLLFGFLALFLFKDFFSPELSSVPSVLLDMNTMWISIVLEAIPFVLLGVFISSIIQIFVKEEALRRFIPSNPVLALLPAITIGAIFPVCECAIVPIVRRLLQKGMPLHVGIVILVSAPVLNPIVFLSTFYAFQTDTSIAWERMGLAFFAALLIGALIYRFYGNQNILLSRHSHSHDHHNEGGNRISQVFQHASDEFFDMGKFLIFGALVASAVQTFIARDALVGIGNGALAGPAVMMGLAYILSLCSEADAFVGSSFAGLFSSSAILGFLVYGPMTDLKNTILMLAYFKKRFVLGFLVIVTVAVYITIIVFQTFIY